MRTDTSSGRRRGRGGQGALVLPAQVGCSQVFSGGMARTALPSATSELPRDFAYSRTRLSESPTTRLQHPGDAVPCGRGPEAGRALAGRHVRRSGEGPAFPQPLSPVLGQNQGVQLWSYTPKLSALQRARQLHCPATEPQSVISVKHSPDRHGLL